MSSPKKLRVALVGTDSLQAQEIKRVLETQPFPLGSIEFFDPGVKEAFSKLTDFKDEPKVIQALTDDSLNGKDIVFLAADPETDRRCGLLAEKLGFKAVDLSEAFNDRADVPLVVAGVNDGDIDPARARLVANPHPATIILGHLFQPVLRGPGIAKAVAFILQPASAFGGKGIDELAGQSVSLFSGTALPTGVFKQQMAFNLLSHTEKPSGTGFSPTERRIIAEVRRVLHRPALALSLSVIQASQFHTYGIMSYLELDKETDLAGMESLFRDNPYLKRAASDEPCSVSCISVAGKDEVFIGQLKKEESFPRSFWVWSMADNLTRGSALNAFAVARTLAGEAGPS
jgi:aspartate-semialdehyde dehydrogenase